MIPLVTLFCGSRDAVEDKHFAAAHELGEKLARCSWRLVYGGGSVGLMGVPSRAVLPQGGHVTGVIPRALLDLRVGNRNVSDLIVTDGLRDRKAIRTSAATRSSPCRAGSGPSRDGCQPAG